MADRHSLTHALVCPSPVPAPLGSVIIPAHNEAAVIGRCLAALFSGFSHGELEVVVVCNGCSDHTANRARACGHSIRVLELEQASKPMALRAGDAAAASFPRLYLDADVVLPGTAARSVLQRLSNGAVVARPPIRYDAGESSALVRSYYRARSRVPAVQRSLWGAGVCGLSAEGRRRFGMFPDVVADDLWLDRQFQPDEVEIVDTEPVVVMVPRSSRDLLAILRRAYRGKGENRPPSGVDTRALRTTVSTLADLTRTLASKPSAGLDAASYVGFATGARLALAVTSLTGRGPRPGAWERDESSRMGVS